MSFHSFYPEQGRRFPIFLLCSGQLLAAGTPSHVRLVELLVSALLAKLIRLFCKGKVLNQEMPLLDQQHIQNYQALV